MSLVEKFGGTLNFFKKSKYTKQNKAENSSKQPKPLLPTLHLWKISPSSSVGGCMRSGRKGGREEDICVCVSLGVAVSLWLIASCLLSRGHFTLFWMDFHRTVGLVISELPGSFPSSPIRITVSWNKQKVNSEKSALILVLSIWKTDANSAMSYSGIHTSFLLDIFQPSIERNLRMHLRFCA